MDYQDSMFEIKPSGDSLHVVCVKCMAACELDFKGRDALMVKIEIKCPNCGSTGDWKLWRPGFHLPRNAAAHETLDSRLTTRLDG